jgi:hypothetical protein
MAIGTNHTTGQRQRWPLGPPLNRFQTRLVTTRAQIAKGLGRRVPAVPIPTLRRLKLAAAGNTAAARHVGGGAAAGAERAGSDRAGCCRMLPERDAAAGRYTCGSDAVGAPTVCGTMGATPTSARCHVRCHLLIQDSFDARTCARPAGDAPRHRPPATTCSSSIARVRSFTRSIQHRI